MKPTVLVTGAGGAAVPTLIDYLCGRGYRVIVTDCDPDAVGLRLADAGYVVPRGDAKNFASVLRGVCQAEKVSVIIPLVDEELVPALELESDGVTVLSPRAEFVSTCLDKWQCMQVLRASGVRVPITDLFTGTASPYYPAIVKPRVGRGSRGVRSVANSGELLMLLIERQLAYSEDLLAQEYIEGTEYTVSVVCWRDNVVRAVVPKEIIAKHGMTRMAVTRRNERVDTVCRRIAEVLKPGGPFNVQLRLKNGEPYVFEINPRFSGTVNLTIAAGCDEVGGLLALALGKDADFFNWCEGVVLIRRYVDEVVSEAEFAQRSVEVRRCES